MIEDFTRNDLKGGTKLNTALYGAVYNKTRIFEKGRTAPREHPKNELPIVGSVQLLRPSTPQCPGAGCLCGIKGGGSKVSLNRTNSRPQTDLQIAGTRSPPMPTKQKKTRTWNCEIASSLKAIHIQKGGPPTAQHGLRVSSTGHPTYGSDVPIAQKLLKRIAPKPKPGFLTQVSSAPHQASAPPLKSLSPPPC